MTALDIADCGMMLRENRPSFLAGPMAARPRDQPIRTAEGDGLTTQADGQPEFEIYDGAGDFYPLQFDAVLRPGRKADGTYTFTLLQDRAMRQAEAHRRANGRRVKEDDGNYRAHPAPSSSCRASGR
jgi:hypothetical protein